MGDIYEYTEEYNPNKERKILITSIKYWLYAIIWLLICLAIKHVNQALVTELFIRGRKLNISLVFITQSYFDVPKNIRLNCI